MNDGFPEEIAFKTKGTDDSFKDRLVRGPVPQRKTCQDPNLNRFLILVRDHFAVGPRKRRSSGIFLSITNDTLRLLPPHVHYRSCPIANQHNQHWRLKEFDEGEILSKSRELPLVKRIDPSSHQAAMVLPNPT